MPENDPFLQRDKQVCELLLIRHADAIPEADEIIPGGIYDDLPLSRKGRQQALALAERLQTISCAALYSSPLRRCQETAAPLLERLNKPLILVPEIKEVRLSQQLPPPIDHEDRTALVEALWQRQHAIIAAAAASGSWDSVEGSEPSAQFRARVVKGINEITTQHFGERILVFTHGGVINAYLAEVLGLDKDFFFPCGNTSVSIVRTSGTHRIVYAMNDLHHIRQW